MDLWVPETRLYLYHGTRFCVGNESDSDVGPNKDAPIGMYDHQKRNSVYETVHGIKHLLKTVMGTHGMNQYPVLNLYFENNQENFGQ